MQITKIEWAKNPDGSPGYTWNPITGCLNGCPYCYARKLANGRLKSRYLANKSIAPVPEAITLNEVGRHLQDPFYPRSWFDRRERGLESKKPKGVFVCDMSDLFGIGIPSEWTGRVFNLIKLHDNNRYYLLTKQPQNLAKFSPFPDNCFVGVSATTQEQYVKAFWELNKIEARVKFISFEPLLEEIKLTPMFAHYVYNWVIIGAQTKPYKPPKIEWVQEIVSACDIAKVPVFLKYNLLPIMKRESPEISSFYKYPRSFRQELPSA